jgi:hypothetical protein
MEIKPFHNVPFRVQSRPIGESLETQKIRLLGQRIREIERETQFIKENGHRPNVQGQSYFLKKLNTL